MYWVCPYGNGEESMKRKQAFIVCALFVLLLPSLAIVDQNFAICQKVEDDSALDSLSLEAVFSRRNSIRQFNLSVNVPWELISKVLWAAYGYSWSGRTVPTLSSYPITIYVCNQTAAYRFVPANQSFTLWKQGDYRDLGGGYDAPIQLYIILDTNVCPDVLWGNAESGCAIQNIYLMANALNLGTVCQYIRTGVAAGLGLPAHEQVLYKMPIGYPLPPYADYQNLVAASRPSSLELPEISDSAMSLEDGLNSVFASNGWGITLVTTQELSQILWAGYGYSYYEDTAASPPKSHRTVPSSHSYYPMKIYVANSSGVYEYAPEQHTLTLVVTGDRRVAIAQASGNTWVSSAPLLLAVAYIVDERPYIGGEETYVEIGLITQSVCLEGTAWGLMTNWGKADANEDAMRTSLGLTGQTTLHPVSIITVGHPVIADDVPPTISATVQEPPENVSSYQSVIVNVNVTDGGSGVRDVTLWYSIDNGTTWVPLNMGEIATSLYQTTVPGYANGTWMKYKVIANDNNGNHAIEDNNGYNYSYQFVPENITLFSIILILSILTLTIIIGKRKLPKVTYK